MGTLETELKRERRNRNIQKAILASVAVAGVLSVAAVAPNALQAMGILMRNGKRKNRNLYYIESSRARLVKNGLLEYEENGFIKITAKGEAKLRQLELCDYRLKKPKRWDKKWRMLSFDIKEVRRSLRNKIRATLITIGFERLHYSLWVYPYDCEDLITLLKADFKVGRDLIYIIADKIENDAWLQKRFGLS